MPVRFVALGRVAVALCLACGSSTTPGPDASCTPSDADGDGYDAIGCGGDDCDDENPAVQLGVEEDETWSIETVVDGRLPHAAVGSNGVVHLVYQDAAHGISYGRREGSAWEVAQFHESPATSFSDIVEALGTVHVLYSWADFPASINHIMHAQNSGTGWEIADTGLAGADGPLAVDDLGALHMAFSTEGGSPFDLHHATYEGDRWQDEVVASWPCWGSARSIAIDPTGTVHIIHVVPCDGACEPSAFFYTTDSSGDWTTESMGVHGELASIAFDGTGAPVVAVMDAGSEGDACMTDTNTLLLSRRGETGWGTETIDETRSFPWTPGFSLASDADGSLHLVFASSDGLWYEADPSATAERELIDEFASGFEGVSVAVDGQFVHVAYGVRNETGEPTIRYARRSLPDGLDNDCDGVAW